MAALPAMTKYGVGSPVTCYASSIGIRDRATATNLAANCPYPVPTFRQFLDSLSQLTTDECTHLDSPYKAGRSSTGTGSLLRLSAASTGKSVKQPKGHSRSSVPPDHPSPQVAKLAGPFRDN